MEDNKPKFSFEKKIGIHGQLYGDIPALIEMIERLFYCMKETNKNHNVECEFFRLDFRQPYFDEELEFPRGCLILDLKFGSKEELDGRYVNHYYC